ncbi:MAG: hypothetical protein E5W99_19560, partial [Mesorhizobium sp.]
MREADTGEFVEVPGDTTLWKTQGVAPRRIDLPLEARGRFSWYAPLFGIAAALALSSSVKYYSSAVQNWQAGNSLDRVAWAAEVFGCLFVSVLFVGMFVRVVLDAANPVPLLILTRETLWDRRQLHEPVPWSAIESIRVQSFRGTLLVYLRLAQPVPVRSGLFRLGGALRGGLKSNIRVLISHLDQNDETIAKVLAALVRKNGGKVEGYSAYASY